MSKKFVQESLSLAECIGDIRLLLMQILSDSQTDSSNKKGNLKSKAKNNTIPINLQNSSMDYDNSTISQELNSMTEELLEECHKTFIGCYHAFYPTANLKWQCLCDLLVEMDKVIILYNILYIIRNNYIFKLYFLLFVGQSKL